MQLKDIEGQQILANRLTEIIDSGRISHAQLFLGPAVCGSLALALAYVQYLCCENRQHYGEGAPLRADSCGECPSCRKMQALMHPDLHLVFPSTTTPRVKSNPCAEDFQEDFREFMGAHGQRGKEEEWYAHLGVENKQGMIGKRDADNIIRTLSMKAYEGGYKTLVVWMAERMNLSAANTLLKTLEEPSPQTLILLVAEQKDKMLQTILSRVQQVTVPETTKALPPADYAPLFVGWMRLLFRLDMAQLSECVDTLAGLGRERQKHFLGYALEWLRACFLHTAGGITLPGELDFGDEKFDNSFPKMITPNNIEQIERDINEALAAIERNAHPKITFMQLSFNMSKNIKNR